MLVPICSFKIGPSGDVQLVGGGDSNWLVIQDQFKLSESEITKHVGAIGSYGTRICIRNCTGELSSSDDDIVRTSEVSTQNSVFGKDGSKDARLQVALTLRSPNPNRVMASGLPEESLWSFVSKERDTDCNHGDSSG